MRTANPFDFSEYIQNKRDAIFEVTRDAISSSGAEALSGFVGVRTLETPPDTVSPTNSSAFHPISSISAPRLRREALASLPA